MVPDAVDTHLDLHRIQLRGNDNTFWVTQHAIHVDVWNQWRVRVRDGPVVEYVEALSYPSDEYIRWYRSITRVYIGNPANRDTRTHGYQPAGVDRRMMEHVDPHPAVVERGEGSSGGQHYIDPFDSPHLDMPSCSLGLTPDPESLPSGSGTLQIPPAPSSGFIAFQSLNPLAYGFGRFSAPPPPDIAGVSTPHQPISQASSSDEEEGQNALGRGHRVGKKTVRFTPSEWP
ncbi:hypothetical protein M9H77_27980 [Catharanthus roseus]|uniref:Uncharacterized protein n=1 Tax=Catharanthus roseus TaxID=4058 RepID=A0ACC0AE09_CATRO|nr:hypothetical protein M9H77_27980 [Catharanthus roseus]